MLHRAHRVAPLIESIEGATSCAHRILFVATEGDAAVIDAVNACGAECEVIPPNPVGDYAIKINHGYRVTDEPYLFLGADDLEFHPGWFEAAVCHFEDPAVGVVGTLDMANSRVTKGRHATHSLVARSYVDAHGTIDGPGVLHEGYIHEFVDDEFIQTAMMRNAFRFEPESVVEHLHPMVGKAPMDELYAASRHRMRIDRGRYARRRRLWTSR